jgi:hypothetical protein
MREREEAFSGDHGADFVELRHVKAMQYKVTMLMLQRYISHISQVTKLHCYKVTKLQCYKVQDCAVSKLQSYIVTKSQSYNCPSKALPGHLRLAARGCSAVREPACCAEGISGGIIGSEPLMSLTMA